MSTIYSAGQYDDAFTPKKLGNWESTAKESYPFRKTPKLHTPKIIVDSRGHLLPWVPRGDRSSSWGLLNLHLRNKYNRTKSMVFMSGPGKQASTNNGQSSLSIHKRLKKLPRFAPRKVEHSPPPDLLLEYLQHLSLPVVWIIGPSTRNTFQKRKQFSKQLASSLKFGYVNLDEKVQEWKERQQICTCSSNSLTSTANPPSSPPHGPLHSLASTSIAPSKLPTNVPPFISPNIPSPPQTSEIDLSEYLLNILESQRITFDTALPIERNKILELYKFAMAECLPCEGFVMDSVPFDLVEGLQFEKIFYPAALAIYFTEGVPQRKQRVKPKDRRVTASTATSIQSTKKVSMSPLDYLERTRKQNENVYLKTKSHKRLGVFSVTEGEKICKQFGSKTIRIINAEDVEHDTMEFLNELVRRNLDRYHDILQGNAKLDMGGLGGQLIPCSSADLEPPSPVYSSSFISEDEEKTLRENEELERMSRFVFKETNSTHATANSHLPPALVTAKTSETSLFTLPNIFSSKSESSNASSVEVTPRTLAKKEDESEVRREEAENNVKLWNTDVEHDERVEMLMVPPKIVTRDNGGAGDHAGDNEVTARERRKSAELWERIVKLESKVADLNTPEETCLLSAPKAIKPCSPLQIPFEEYDERQRSSMDHIPPPTAYAEKEYLDKEEEEKFTAAIRNAIGPHYVAAALHHEYQYAPPQDYLTPSSHSRLPPDYGASGDSLETQEQFQWSEQNRKTPPKELPIDRQPTNNNYQQYDPFYD